ncbi:MAG: hypothetical protein OXS28_16565 [Gammaproteobacteria bacterium]|nr:hypothetical protein [Gammaproteobacteria bacterium]
MTQDIIHDTTVSFIRANERNLQLAFQVEKAMPVVREKLIKDFFECVKKHVEKQLTEKVETIERWEIKVEDTKGLFVRKKDWGKQLKVGKYSNSNDWWGIRLLSKTSGWKQANISVANIESILDGQKKRFREKFHECIGICNEGGPHMWRFLEFEDFESLDFLKKMMNDKDEEREKIIKDLADKLAKLAVAVDKVLSNSG